MINKILTLKNHAGFMRYLKNSSWMFGEQMLRMVAGLLVGIWVARYLGPEQFGIFSYVVAFTALFSSIAKLGLDGILVRELVNHPDQQEVYLGTAFWMKVLGAFLVMALIALVLPWTSNDSTTTLYIFIIASGLIFQSFEVVDFYFQSQVLAKFVSICKVIQLTLSSLLKIYLVLIGAELIWFVWVILFDQLTLAITLFIAYRHQKVKFLPLSQFDSSVARRLLKDSWPLIFSSMFAMIYLRIDQIMIKEMIGEKDVGIYAAAVKISEIFYFIPILLTTSVFPAILSAKKNNTALYMIRLQRLYTILIWTALVLALTISLIGKSMIVILFGQEYKEAGNVLVIHIWSSIFIFISAGFGRYLLAENLSLINMYRVILGAITNIFLNFILIPIYGIIGAAYGTLFSLILINYGVDLLNKNLWPQLRMKITAFYYPLLFAHSLLIQRKTNETNAKK